MQRSRGLRDVSALRPAFATQAADIFGWYQALGDNFPFTQIGPLSRADSLLLRRHSYCPSSATELFSMCSRIPGTIEPVFS